MGKLRRRLDRAQSAQERLVAGSIRTGMASGKWQRKRLPGWANVLLSVVEMSLFFVLVVVAVASQVRAGNVATVVGSAFAAAGFGLAGWRGLRITRRSQGPEP